MTDIFIKHVALNIPEQDVELAKAFYQDFGLRISHEAANRINIYCDGVDHPSIVLLIGHQDKALDHLEIGVSNRKMQKIKARLDQHHIESHIQFGQSEIGIWFSDPQGILFHVIEAEDSYKEIAVNPFMINAPGHKNRINQGALPPKSTLPAIRPRRMGHVLLFTPDVNASLKFLEQIFEMRLSDRSGNGVVFTHCAEGSEHHVIAFAKSSHIGFHHASFLVSSPDEVGLGGQRMQEKGHQKGWGFGRHSIGSNFFYYVADPWGSYVEYYADMDYIQNSNEWRAKNWPQEDALHSWGPQPPHDFTHNYEPNHLRA
ncbi:VOC family protein [Acinetobacter sp. S40]|uniref:VOC family protein n=1 Tax=Acinetobacter sp. S40 TaxID=2767434 RepID=UPI00190DEB74|nr:VOC family protein [Acinetobacter sp. S40]MBJ9984782.1 VOC family protein [Acinetobacter sp. S40]